MRGVSEDAAVGTVIEELSRPPVAHMFGRQRDQLGLLGILRLVAGGPAHGEHIEQLGSRQPTRDLTRDLKLVSNIVGEELVNSLMTLGDPR